MTTSYTVLSFVPPRSDRLLSIAVFAHSDGQFGCRFFPNLEGSDLIERQDANVIARLKGLLEELIESCPDARMAEDYISDLLGDARHNFCVNIRRSRKTAPNTFEDSGLDALLDYASEIHFSQDMSR